MNLVLEDYFDAVEAYLIESPAVCSYTIIRREVSPVDGKLRVKALLENDSTLEFFLYLIEKNADIQQSKYSFHWQDAQGRVIKRWDNAPHHLALENAPHHVHVDEDNVEAVLAVPNVFFVIDQIETTLDSL